MPISATVTQSQGVITATVNAGHQRYYPFGGTRLTTGTIYTDRLFTGQREMRRPELVEGAGLGIYHFNARFYSPKLGRFVSAIVHSLGSRGSKSCIINIEE